MKLLKVYICHASHFLINCHPFLLYYYPHNYYISLFTFFKYDWSWRERKGNNILIRKISNVLFWVPSVGNLSQILLLHVLRMTFTNRRKNGNNYYWPMPYKGIPTHLIIFFWPIPPPPFCSKHFMPHNCLKARYYLPLPSSQKSA